MLTVDTLTRLEQKQEQLAQLFIKDADLEAWKGMTRGDAYWERKNCAQTLGLVVRIQAILGLHQSRGNTPLGEGGDVDQGKLAAKAEREADEFIKRVRNKTKV
jgi:hypothetical protein